MLINQLISYYVEREVGARCLTYEDIHQLPDFANDGSEEQPKLVLVDCSGKDPQEILEEIEHYGEQGLSRAHFVLLYVDRGLNFEEKLVWKGIRGFFYEEESLEQLLKGVRGILKGEMWFSRKIFMRCIQEGKGQKRLSGSGSSNLTPREVEILTLVATMATNDEIADKLCISPHTVRTHLYNIFQKIEVPNRYQAALWAAKNLPKIIHQFE